MQSEASVILISIPCTYKSCVNLQLRTTSLFRFSLKDWVASRIKRACKVNKTTAVSVCTVTTGDYIVKWNNENEVVKATKSCPRELKSTFAPATETLLASLVCSLWTSHFSFTGRTLKQWSPEKSGWFCWNLKVYPADVWVHPTASWKLCFGHWYILWKSGPLHHRLGTQSSEYIWCSFLHALFLWEIKIIVPSLCVALKEMLRATQHCSEVCHSKPLRKINNSMQSCGECMQYGKGHPLNNVRKPEQAAFSPSEHYPTRRLLSIEGRKWDNIRQTIWTKLQQAVINPGFSQLSSIQLCHIRTSLFFFLFVCLF